MDDNFIDENNSIHLCLHPNADKFKKLEDSEEFKLLIFRCEELTYRCDILTDEIFYNRDKDDVVKRLIDVKNVTKTTLKILQDKIKRLRSNYSKNLQKRKMMAKKSTSCEQDVTC